MSKNLSLSGPSCSMDELYSAIHARMASHGASWNDLRPTIQEFRKALRQIPADGRGIAVDAGCGGTAAAAIACAELGFSRVHALDINRGSLRRARTLISGLDEVIRLSCGSVLAMPFPNETFDFAACLGVAHHTPDPERVVAELSRVLKPGGTLYISLYCFADSLFEGVVRTLRFMGACIPAKAMYRLAAGNRVVNNFVIDHMYVPTLWLFRAEEVRSLLANKNFFVTAEWPSNMDPFVNLAWIGRQLTRDGLMRVWFCKKG